MYRSDYRPPADLLAGRTVLVSGAGDGIGRALSLAAAAHGATVVLLGRTVRKLETVYDQIVETGGARPAIYPLHLEGATPNDYAELADTLRREFDRLDGLAHCAAMFDGLTPIANLAPERWYRTLQVNLNAPFLLTQALLSTLKRSDAASIVFSHDRVGDRGTAYWGPYAVAKAGQQTLMKLLADESEHTALRVNSVDPGPTRTRLRLMVQPAVDPHWPRPAQAIYPYLYLLGRDGRKLNGQTLTLQD